MSVPAFRGNDLELVLLDPVSTPLVRLFHRPRGEWDPPPEARRSLRVDPPAGRKSLFAVLYHGNTLPTVAMECAGCTQRVSSNPCHVVKSLAAPRGMQT
jgi:hypothetical protein